MESLNSLWAQASFALSTSLRKASTVLHSAKAIKGPGKPKLGPFPSQQQMEEDHLNALNDQSTLPASSNVVVVGAGIHSLIYAIHTRLRSKALLGSAGQDDDDASATSITVVERAASPGYKIGESTLTTFGVWLQSIGLSTALLWRLFGPKDGLAFYYLTRDGGDDYTDFCANGPAGDFVATLQIERKISELLLTLFAQRLGVNVYHGHAVDIDSVQMPRETDPGRVKGRLHVADRQGASLQTEADLVIDATGRFRRFASKASRSRRFPGFNTDAFWAYFEMPGDEADIPLRHYESCHTNHICLAEGWAWVIRLPSWEGSPLPNLIAMINHLLDLNAAQTAADDYPSSQELAQRFGLKFRWVVSIGFALRSDVAYPDSLDAYGTCEAERKFNWITSQYPQMTALMQRHALVRDLYGPGTTWFIRKSLSYQSPVAAGAGWAAVGDATGFTNPLYSPGINCNMGPSVWLAEQTPAYISAPSSDVRRDIMSQYRKYCDARVPDLHRMNTFNYLLMRSPQTGPLGPLWQYLCGTGNADWRAIKSFAHIERVAELVTRWEWGSQHPEYIAFADKVIKLLDGPPTEPSQETIAEVMSLSEAMLRRAVETGRFRNRWAGLLRYYDNDLHFCRRKVQRDVLASRCEHCGNWRILTGDAVKCATCGGANKVVAIQRVD